MPAHTATVISDRLFYILSTQLFTFFLLQQQAGIVNEEKNIHTSIYIIYKWNHYVFIDAMTTRLECNPMRFCIYNRRDVYLPMDSPIQSCGSAWRLSAGMRRASPRGSATTRRPNQSHLRHTSLFSLPTSAAAAAAAAVKNPPPHPKHGHWANPPEITTRELTTEGE